jgi:NAD(P)H dehydrogenase (quinone)
VLATNQPAGEAAVMSETTPDHHPKRVLLVTAHPEPESLNGSMARFAANHLRQTGFSVKQSDLYQMGWKAVLDTSDYPDPDQRRLRLLADSGRATLAGTLTSDVAEEQEKIRWADALVLQFPLWWFSVPAIMKGWIDRVFTYEFAHGPSRGLPYTESALGGKRAMLAVTCGARQTAFDDRGIHGPLAEVLHPLQHGLFWFTGIAPLEPFAVYDTHHLIPPDFPGICAAYARRLENLFQDPTVPFRKLDSGDYPHDMRLRSGREQPGTIGLGMHQHQ